MIFATSIGLPRPGVMQLTTRTYQVERSQPVWIVLDAGRLLRARVRIAARNLSFAKLDYAVDAALALASIAAQCSDRVGILVYGRSIQQSIGPGRGAHHMRSIVDALAQVRLEAAEADHARAATTLLRMQSRRALIVWITDFAETATTPEVIGHALRMTRRHLVLFTALTQPDLIALTKAIPQTEEEMFRAHSGSRNRPAPRTAVARSPRTTVCWRSTWFQAR